MLKTRDRAPLRAIKLFDACAYSHDHAIKKDIGGSTKWSPQMERAEINEIMLRSHT